jgi:hypothetical protein
VPTKSAFLDSLHLGAQNHWQNQSQQNRMFKDLFSVNGRVAPVMNGIRDGGAASTVIPREGGVSSNPNTCDQARAFFKIEVGVYWIIRFRG